MKRHRTVRRSALAHLSRAVEQLEQRQFFNAAYFPLTTANPLNQDWENKALISVDDDWSGVPSIEGYDGAGITTTTGLSPTSFTAATPTGVIDVDADATTTPTGTSAAGVFEFALSPAVGTSGTNTVALQPGNAAQAPYLKFYIDSTNAAAVRVKYDLIDLDTSTGNAQPFTLQYRTSPTASWINAPDGNANVADASAAGAGKVTSVNSLLPADAAHQATLQLRVITANAAGNDQIIAVDNIAVTAEGAPVGNGSLGLSAASYSTSEGAGTFNGITVTRLGGTQGVVTVDYTISSIAGNTAATPADYGGTLTGTVTFADGQSTAVILPVSIVQDTHVEGTETFNVALSNITGGATASTNQSATVSITDDDVAGTFAFSSPTYTTTEGAGAVATLTITRTGGSADPVTVNYSTTDGSATSPGDYTSTSSSVVFANGQTTATITIPITNDAVGEASENFTVTINSVVGTGSILGTPATATVTINDDDTNGTLTFVPSTYTVAEGVGTFQATVKRIGGTSGAVSATYTLTNGTATSPGDYTAATGVITFADGVDTATINVTITNDTTVETNESFTIVLSNPTGGATVGAAATVTITDDDTAIPTGLLINEVFIDPPGVNQPYQYIEIKGTPGTILSNVYVLAIEGDLGTGSNTSNPGQLEGTIDLTGAVIGSNGLLMVTSAAGFQKPAGSQTGLFTTTFFDENQTGFETGSETILLAYRDPNPSGPALPAFDFDLDSDNTPTAAGSGVGTLDLLPSNITLLDGVGNSDGGAANSDLVYAPRLTPLSATTTNAADAIVRFPTNTTPFDATAYYYGLIVDNDGALTGNQTLTFDSSASAGRRSANFPAGGIVTPYGINFPVPTDTTPPTVVSAVYDPRVGQSILVTFSENVADSLAASDFTLTNTTTGATVTLTKGAVTTGSTGATSVTLTFSNAGGPKDFILANGHYVFTVRAGQVADSFNNALVADSTTSFGFVNGDFNFSGNVNFDDLVALAQNYNKSGAGIGFVQGDANYDGVVNFDDLVVLAQNYNRTAPVSVMAVAAAFLSPTAAPVLAPAIRAPTKTLDKKQDPIDITPVAVVKTPVVKTPAKFSSAKIA